MAWQPSQRIQTPSGTRLGSKWPCQAFGAMRHAFDGHASVLQKEISAFEISQAGAPRPSINMRCQTRLGLPDSFISHS